MDVSAGLFAITLVVEDLEGAKSFYARAFGQESKFEDDDSAVFTVGTTMVNLLRATAAPDLVEPAQVGAPSAGVRAVYTIPVDDVDAACAELDAAGITLLNGPMDRPWGPRTASFRDPAGHVWELAH